MRTELRRLRSIKLIEMKKDREVNQMRDDLGFDLADYATLTPLGDRWVKRIKELYDTEVSDHRSQNAEIAMESLSIERPKG